MAVTNTSTYASLVGNGVATAFPFPFAAASAAEVAVSVNGTPISGFSVTRAAQGGTVTFASPPPSGASVLIQSAPSFQQTATFANEGGFQPAVFDAVHDRLAISDLYLLDGVSRSLRAPPGEVLAPLPSRAARAGHLLALGSDVSGAIGFLDANMLRSTVPGPPGQGSIVGVTPEMFGAKGDGVTNDTDAFAALSAYIQARGGGVIELSPGATYVVGKQVPVTGAPVRGDIVATHRTLAPSRIIWLHGDPFGTGQNLLPHGVVIRGNCAALKVAPGLKYGMFNPQTGLPAPDFAPMSPTADLWVAYNALVGIQNSRGPVIVENLFIDGSCEDATWGGRYGDYDWQVPGSGIYCQYNARTQIDNCFVRRCLLDGWQGDAIGPTLITNSDFVENVRLGGNLRGGSRFMALNSKFNGSGTSGHSTNPAAGFDAEQEIGGYPIDRAVFIGCQFAYSFYQQFASATGTIRGALLENCLLWARAEYGAAINLFQPQFVLRGCTIGGALQFGISADDGGYGLPVFEHCLLTDNLSYGPDGLNTPSVGIGGNDFVANAAGTVFKRCAFDYSRTPFNGGPQEVGYEDCYISGPNRNQVLSGAYSKGCDIRLPGVDLSSSSSLRVLDGSCTLNGILLTQNVGLRPSAYTAPVPALSAAPVVNAVGATPTQAEFNALVASHNQLVNDAAAMRATINARGAAMQAATLERAL